MIEHDAPAALGRKADSRPLHLVFGASGYIGSNLVPELLRAGRRVRATARNIEVLQGRGWQGAEFSRADALDPATLAPALAGVDVAYYLVHSMAAGSNFGAIDRVAAENFARAELAKGDDAIREADRLLAQAIRVVAGLYKDGIIPKPASYAYPFPDLLTFHDAATVVEQRLFEMHLKHRMRAFQGAFHANPDYALWYGWSEMVRDLTDIQEEAAELRERRSR